MEMSPDSDHAPAAGAPLHQRLAAVGRKNPNKVAVFANRTQITYKSLLDRIDALSAQLAEAGIKPGEYIAVILPNGVEFIAAIFAIWQRGAILVPLHVHFQEDEIYKYTVDCGVRGIIADARFNLLVEAIIGRPSGVEHAWIFSPDGVDHKSADRGNRATKTAKNETLDFTTSTPDWPALSQYSTGSTGFSKRITRTHRQLLEEYDAVASLLKIGADDKILGVAPFFHSYGLSNGALASLLSGATLHAVGDFFPKDIAKLIEQEKLTGFPGVPFMYQLLVEQRQVANLSSLRYALSAGAPLPATTAHAFLSQYGVGIRQLYGSTETGVISVESTPAAAHKAPNAGRPIPRVKVTIVDESGSEVPKERDGRVAISSPFAATSYDNLKATSESYFSDDLFFPGDLGRMEINGELVLIGRKRRFINVAGNKVDPTEIETFLRECPAITEAVVLGLPDGAASEKVKAVLVTSVPFSRADVLEHCKKLAVFKRPRVIEFRTEIPKSPLGKILVKYLIGEQATPNTK